MTETATTTTFRQLLARVIPPGMSEEQWARRKRLETRLLRRAKAGNHLRDATIARLVRAMSDLGGTPKSRAVVIREAISAESLAGW